MNDKIMIYSKTACEEIHLPTISEQKFLFCLEKSLYHIDEDVIIEMQVLDHSWCFSESKKYRILKEQEVWFMRQLSFGDILKLRLMEGDEWLLVIGSQQERIPVLRKYMLDKKKEITLGSRRSNDICLRLTPLISGSHAKLEYVTGGWRLRDTSSNGTYINGRKVQDFQMLDYGDQIEIFGCRFLYLKDILAILNKAEQVCVQEGSLREADQETMKWISLLPVYADDSSNQVEFHPAPRIIAEYDTEEFEIEAPPSPKKQKERSLLMTLGPSLTMAVPMLVGVVITGMGSIAIGLVTMVGSAVIGAFWAYMNRRAQNKSDKEDEEERFRKYSDYLKKKEEELKKAYEFNAEELRKMYPATSECVEYHIKSRGLWNRNPNQEDYLYIRLGEGEQEMPKPIRIPQERFTLIDDSLAEEPARIKAAYETLKKVPEGIDLAEHPLIGLIGGKDCRGAYPVLYTLIAQIVANLSYNEVKIVLLCDKDRLEDRKLLEAVKWLPHIWDGSGSCRFAGDSRQTTIQLLNEGLLQELRKRKEERQSQRGAQLRFSPWYILIATSTQLLEESQASVYLFDQNEPIGTTTILCAEEFGSLPNSCEYMIQNNESFAGSYSVKDARNNWKKITFDRISEHQLNQLSHRLAAIQVKTPQMQKEMPSSITFLEMYGAGNTDDLQIERRWDSGKSYETMQVPIGMRSGNLLCMLDIHQNAHGSHGLVAGTTGSGKSEMLQTLILSLAVNFSPEEISFFLVDFKGGSMAEQFEGLPHLTGYISNLKENQIHRALVSIRSENVRRQRLFNETGIKDIDIYKYTRLYKNHEVTEPLPHLLIVVDEFAELKKEYPEFMSELISVAAIGRSLGVHLLLATQKPAGTVDDKIDSNTQFRICLKVQNQQDSNDILKHPDAAYITQTGRGYLRVGTDEVYEQFQSAWSGASYREDSADIREEIAKLYTVNGGTEIVGNHQKIQRREEARRQWTAQLSQAVSEVLKESRIPAKTCLMNPDAMQSVTRKLYQYFQKKEWNVNPSAANDSRIFDLLTVYDACESRYGQTFTADQMNALAKSMGRVFPEQGNKTQLGAVVDAIHTIAVRRDLILKNQLWLKELPSRLYLNDLDHTGAQNGNWEDAQEIWSLEACVGRYDDPAHQYQAPVSVDFANQGNYAVCGNVSSGKSTFLQTLMYSLITRYSPKQVNLYALDFSSRMLECFEDAPHVGGILYEQTMENVGKFFFLIQQILADRKQILRGGNYSQYMQSGKKGLPAVVIVIDQYGAFREKTERIYDAQILQLAKEGYGNGIYMILSAGSFSSGEIPLKLADNLKGVFCLQLNDRFQYREILKTSAIEIEPEEVKGRGLMNFHGEALEFQTALALEAENDYERSHHIQKICAQMKENWKGSRARRIPVIPKEPTYAEFINMDEVKALLEDDRHLPLGYSVRSASPWSLDMSRFYCYLVSGKKRTGKKNFLQMAMRMAAHKGGKIYVFGNGSGILKKTAEETGAVYYSSEDDLTPFCTEFKPELLRRNQKKHELEYNGYSDEEIYQEMSREENIFLFIEDLVSFTDRIYHPKEGCLNVSGFFSTFADKGWYHQIFLFAGINQEEKAAVMGRDFYEYVIRDRNGIHFGGNTGGQQILDFSYLSFGKEQSMAQPIGIGLLATGEGRMPAGKVVIPLARKQG